MAKLSRHALVLLAAALAVAQDPPDFVHGEECLFCHRQNIGPVWQKNPHNLTTRISETDPDVIVLGRAGTRRLKKTGYNRLAFIDGQSETNFNRTCARCHTTAVDPRNYTFAYLGIDCFACHGAVDLKHSSREATVPLGKRAATQDHEANAICAACHVRRTAAEPPPAGPDAHIYRAMPPGMSCLSCHSVHARSTERHRRVVASAICLDCHFEGEPRKRVRPYVAREAVCEQLPPR